MISVGVAMPRYFLKQLLNADHEPEREPMAIGFIPDFLLLIRARAGSWCR
jgi:hypothetical protein